MREHECKSISVDTQNLKECKHSLGSRA
jgi:hypothetical protein